MATGKRFYWMKLSEEFMNSDVVDYLMSLKNGANFVVIYEFICLKTINTNGKLLTKIGDLIIPFDSKKLARELNFFQRKT